MHVSFLRVLCGYWRGRVGFTWKAVIEMEVKQFV